MEKAGSIRFKLLFLLGLFVAALAVSAAMPGAEAGTVLARPEPVEELGPGEFYPESRFGRPPAPPRTGIDRGYASRAVQDMETSDEEGGSRSPAGLQFSDGTLAPSRSRGRPVSSESVASGRERMPMTSVETARPVAPPASSAEPSSVAARKGVQEVALIASDLGFFPKAVFVSRDVPVRMYVTGSSKNTLCIMMDSFQVRKQVRAQKIEEITFTPNVPGKYRFYCPVNGMEGSLIVKDLASAHDLGGDSADDQVGGSSAAPMRPERVIRAPAADKARE